MTVTETNYFLFQKSGEKDSKLIVVPRRRNSQMMEPSSKKKSLVRDVSKMSLSTSDVNKDFHKQKSESSLICKLTENLSKKNEKAPAAPASVQKPTNTSERGWKMIKRSKLKNRKPVKYHELMDHLQGLERQMHLNQHLPAAWKTYLTPSLYCTGYGSLPDRTDTSSRTDM